MGLIMLWESVLIKNIAHFRQKNGVLSLTICWRRLSNHSCKCCYWNGPISITLSTFFGQNDQEDFFIFLFFKWLGTRSQHQRPFEPSPSLFIVIGLLPKAIYGVKTSTSREPSSHPRTRVLMRMIPSSTLVCGNAKVWRNEPISF